MLVQSHLYFSICFRLVCTLSEKIGISSWPRTSKRVTRTTSRRETPSMNSINRYLKNQCENVGFIFVSNLLNTRDF